MRKLLQFLGFYGDEYEENSEDYMDYEEEQPRGSNSKKANKAGRKDEPQGRLAAPRLVFYKGVPSEETKLRLRDALLEGAMVLLDLQKLDADHLEEGRNFINFMGGVAFAHKGVMEQIGPCLYIITPRENMCQWWVEEE